MTATQQVGDGAHISREDIESKLRELRSEVDEKGGNVREYAVVAGAVVAVAVVALAFAWGKRKGKRKTTVVEVRRV